VDLLSLSDQDLWQQAADGSGQAFGLLFDRHARAVYNHCFRLTASWSTAEDLTSTVFLQAWRKRSRVRLHGESCRGWLLAVATNVVRDERRSLRRRLALLRRLPPDGTVADPADEVAGRLDDERRMTEVLAALRRLPAGEQEAVALCLWAGLSYPEAAAALGVAEGTVRSRISRARARLAGLLGGPDAETGVLPGASAPGRGPDAPAVSPPAVSPPAARVPAAEAPAADAPAADAPAAPEPATPPVANPTREEAQ
jgi:RNA polymerase sigma factor (sigma-70 family)